MWDAGKDVVVGMDEVGRGAWAGPLSVGAAVLPRDRRIYKIRDSKTLTEAEREALFARLSDWCVAWSVGHASPQECDQLGMSAALTLAASRALEGLDIGYDHVLLDGNWDFALGGDAEHMHSSATRAIRDRPTKLHSMRGGQRRSTAGPGSSWTRWRGRG